MRPLEDPAYHCQHTMTQQSTPDDVPASGLQHSALFEHQRHSLDLTTANLVAQHILSGLWGDP